MTTQFTALSERSSFTQMASPRRSAGVAATPKADASTPACTSLNMMRLVDPLDSAEAVIRREIVGKRSENDFVVEVSRESLDFLRSFGELGLNVVSVFGGTYVADIIMGIV